jgi:hypothetical protein
LLLYPVTQHCFRLPQQSLKPVLLLLAASQQLRLHGCHTASWSCNETCASALLLQHAHACVCLLLQWCHLLLLLLLLRLKALPLQTLLSAAIAETQRQQPHQCNCRMACRCNICYIADAHLVFCDDVIKAVAVNEVSAEVLKQRCARRVKWTMEVLGFVDVI